MGFNKIVAVSMTELFVQQIENMILSGELAIGEQLPPSFYSLILDISYRNKSPSQSIQRCLFHLCPSADLYAR